MRTAQGSILQSLQNVQSFLVANANILGDVNASGARQDLDAAIVELSTHVANQSGNDLASMGLTQRQYSLRKALLRDHMVKIAATAAAKLPPTPEVAPLRMPLGKPTVQRLAAHAAGMAKAAAPYAAVFTTAGLPPDFIAQLTAASEAVVASMTDRAQTQSSRRGATTGLKVTLSSGRKIVHMLDAYVTSALKDNPSLLSSWNGVKRVRVIPSRPTDATTPAPVPAVETPLAEKTLQTQPSTQGS